MTSTTYPRARLARGIAALATSLALAVATVAPAQSAPRRP